MVGRSGVMIG
jgi:hypothetical protein